jgi:hypothetical protein
MSKQFGNFSSDGVTPSGKRPKEISWSWDEDGIATLTEVEYWDTTGTTMSFDPSGASGDWDGIVIGAVHSDYSYMRCVGGASEYQGLKEHWKVRMVYKGANTSTCHYSIKTPTSTEPIETHPDFTSNIGGTGDNPLNDAVFDDNQSDAPFKYFPSGAGNGLQGVKSYLMPNITVEESCVFQLDMVDDCPDWLSVDSVGSQYSPDCPPDVSGLPTWHDSDADGYEWLLVAKNQDVIGGAIRGQYTYRLSGYRGWNDLIYD